MSVRPRTLDGPAGLLYPLTDTVEHMARQSIAYLPEKILSPAWLEHESQCSMIGPVLSLDWKQTGKSRAGRPQAGFDVAGAGNRFTVRPVRHSHRKLGATDRLDLGSDWRPSSTPQKGDVGNRPV
jgi:hypothetical protein